ncbi:MAG: hypothetical protein Q7S81_00135 [bacterium]|nr:hypothetical protein [bacterium]
MMTKKTIFLSLFSFFLFSCQPSLVAYSATASPLDPLMITSPESFFKIKPISSYDSASSTFVPLIQENYIEPQDEFVATATPAEIATSTQKTEPIVVLIEFVKSIFAAFFRLFGFGK